MDLRAIFFDLDGTLLDTLSDIAAAGNYAIQQLGQPTHPENDFRMMVGEGADVLVRKALPLDKQHLADEALRLFKSYYETNAIRHTTVYPGIAELLDALTRRGILLAVVTNKPQVTAQIVVERLLGRWKWAAIAGHRDGIPKKPGPTSTLAIARSLGLPPSRCGFLGDSHIDMQTAVASGTIPIGAAWGFRGRQELQVNGARVVIDHPMELLSLLGPG